MGSQRWASAAQACQRGRLMLSLYGSVRHILRIMWLNAKVVYRWLNDVAYCSTQAQLGFKACFM